MSSDAPEDEFTAIGIARNSVHLNGIDWVFENHDDVEDDLPTLARDRSTELRDATLIKGLLWVSSQMTVDLAFEDLRTLGSHKSGPDAWMGTSVIGGLPGAFASHYTVLFAQKFLVALVDVTASLANSWSYPPTVAHELALRAVLDQAEVLRESIGIELDSDWRGRLEDSLFQDLDHEILYDAVDDEDHDGQPGLGMAPMDFASWFVPFNSDDRRPAPYAFDTSRTLI